MALVAWNEELSVHIAVLDEQHRGLVALINKLHTAMKDGKGREVLGEILEGLNEYVTDHFRTEERLFEQHGYPMACSHRAEHESFVRKLAGFRKRVQSGRVAVSIEMITYLTEWLEHHVGETDRSYSEFLTTRGVR